MLVYVAIIWANATALTLIGRNLLGSMFQFGFHYTILGYDVYLGEVLLSIAAILIFGFVCIRGKRFSVHVQVVLAVLLFGGIVICAVAVLRKHYSGMSDLAPVFSPSGRNPISQVAWIIALAPWAFVGFESVSQSTEGFKFSTKRFIWIMAAALVTGALSYILLTLIAVSILPESYQSWPAWLAELGNLGGLKGLPTFFATNAAMGNTGLIILGVTVSSAIITGLVGNFIAASRLLYAMAEDGILPKWFGKLNDDNTPQNAMLFLMAISVFIPFVGRTAIGWIVDVNTIGASIAYGYTSAAALVTARKEGNRKYMVTGVIGLVMAVFFFFFFMSWSAGSMSTESYLILAGWSILGFAYSRYVFRKDQDRRFGKSTVVWVGLLFLIFFTTLMWVRQATQDVTGTVLDNLNAYNISELEKHGVTLDETETVEAEYHLEKQMSLFNDTLTRNSIIQIVLILFALIIMLSIYNTISRREKEQEVKRLSAEESNKAKTVFLSNMSHDIRTPMNAIIGYTNLAEREDNDASQMREYLGKIKASSHHLLALINDVLEMSRIESGKMDLEPIPVDLRKTMAEVKDMFATQMAEKKIDFIVDTSHVTRGRVLCDKNRLNRVLLNLLSNAYKFTPEGGTVSVTLWEIGDGEDGNGRYELRVKDSGIGMTPEFAAKVFEAFERERNSTVSGIQGTGLGMAITKSIVDLMGGTIEVITAPEQGTEFVIRLFFPLQKGDLQEEEETEEISELNFSNTRLLLVEDNEINREIATQILEEAGFALDTAENGKEAVEKVAKSHPGDFDAVLMDIQMPVMNGYDAAKAIRALKDPALARIPIIAMTANAFSEDIKAAEAAGMNAHIAKPLDMQKMMATLTEVLRKK